MAATCLRNIISLCLVGLLCPPLVIGATGKGGLRCALRRPSNQLLSEESEYSRNTFSQRHGSSNQGDPYRFGTILADNKTVICNDRDMHCYSQWEADPNNKSKPLVKFQGCWINPGDQCENPVCQNSLNPKENRRGANNTGFCCCNSDMCNMNFSVDYIGPSHVPTSPSPSTGVALIGPDPNYKERTIIIALASVCGVAIVTILAYLTYRLCLGSQKPEQEPPPPPEDPPIIDYQLDSLKVCNLIQKGRYGEVWQGVLADQEVAIKFFTPHQRQYYRNEKDIYLLPHMSHRAVPKFYGGEERIDAEGSSQYIIVMSYVREGTLMSNLKHNVIDWSTLCKMGHSVASGLAHLHMDIYKDDMIKPAIAHRDFNTRNILVQPDRTCVICDFGFAMKIVGGRYYRNGHEEVAEQSSINDVGTLRYMAPEVLDGAVNLRDCEASLKQIDVYALGLVLWEIASRCSDLYQGLPVPEYQLPLQQEAGMHPSFEEMQVLVSRNKTRPAFPDVWKDTNPAMRALKETIEDSWDQDAEARLTALCVEERLNEMATLWDGRHKGITPTAAGGNASAVLATLSEKGPVEVNQTTEPEEETSSDSTSDSQEMEGVAQGVQQIAEQVPLMRPSRSSNSDYSVSASTVEVTLSPSEDCATLPSKYNRNQRYAQNNRVLQPHQGQNPTVERNTHKRSDEDVTVVGNTLVNNKNIYQQRNLYTPSNGGRHRGGEDFDGMSDNLDTSLVQNDMLNQYTRHHPVPIPMVQNQVRGSNPSTRPKESNLVGTAPNLMTRPPNQPLPQQAMVVQDSKSQPRSMLAKFLKGKKEGKFSLPSFFSRSSSNERSESSSLNQVQVPTVNVASPPAPPPRNSDININMNPSVNINVNPSVNVDPNINVSVNPVPPEEDTALTQVSVINEGRLQRPQTLLVNGQSDEYNVDRAASRLLDETAGGAGSSTEVGVARLDAGAALPAAIAQIKSRSSEDVSPTGIASSFTDSGADSSDTCTSEEQPVHRRGNLGNAHKDDQRKSNTYRAERTNNIEEGHKPEPNNQDQRKRKDNRGGKSSRGRHLVGSRGLMERNAIHKRSKTSNQGKGDDRLSLNDDRIMSPTMAEPVGKHSMVSDEAANKSSISLQQFGSSEPSSEHVRPADIQC